MVNVYGYVLAKNLNNNSIMISSLFCLRYDDGSYEGHCQYSSRAGSRGTLFC
jgi:hypothetical protein